MDSNLDQVQLPQLNLPHFEPQLLEKEGRLWIFDSLRKKHLVLTPEEWVRQHWINFLINQLKFPKGLLALEKGLLYNKYHKELKTPLLVITNGLQHICLSFDSVREKFTQEKSFPEPPV